jgi:hypothetical protein
LEELEAKEKMKEDENKKVIGLNLANTKSVN